MKRIITTLLLILIVVSLIGCKTETTAESEQAIDDDFSDIDSIDEDINFSELDEIDDLLAELDDI